MSPMSCCGIWRRKRGRKGSGQSEGVPDGGSGVRPSSCAGLRTMGLPFPELVHLANDQPVPDAVPPAPVPLGRQDEQACGQPELPKPYANNYDLWAEALESLKEPERRNMETFACDLDRDSANTKGLVVDIQERIDRALKGQKHDSTARRIIENSVSVLSKFASIGDVAVSFDPVHAALPWAAVRTVLVILTANSELRGQLLAGIAQVASLLVQCDTYQQLYMAPDPTLRPPGAALGRLKTSIIQAYAKSQLFLGFAVQCQQSKIKIDAAFKLEALRGHINTLSESEGQLRQAVHDCERYCNLSSRSNVEELLKLVADFPRTIQRQVESVLEQIDAKNQLEVLEWVSPIPYGQHHITVKEARTSGTCEWLLHHKKFHEWEDISSSAILWLQGSPGTGKTYLTSKVIDHVQGLLEASSTQEGFAYFYCNRNEAQRRDPLSVLRSYVRQLSTAVGSPGHMRKRLRELCSEARRKGSDLGLDVCQDQLLESVNLYSQTTLILDALDECDPEVRWRLVNVIQRLVSESERPLKVFISSRPDDDIKSRFTSRPNIEIQAADNQGDIEKFVNEEIDNPRQWGPISSPLRRDIVNVLLERSQGMFQWANLQIKQVLELPTEEDIRSKLGKLPTGLKDAYDEIYGKISRHNHAKALVDRACMWVMSACTPLRSDELLSAIRVDSGQNTLDLATEITESGLLALCNNLLVFDSQRRIWRFSHLSVVEYFEENHWDLGQAHCHVAKVCLKLLIERYKESKGTYDIIYPKHPLQVYSWRHMTTHLWTQNLEEDDPLLTGLLATFRGTPGGEVLLFAGQHRDIHHEEYVATDLRFRYPNLDDLSPGLRDILIDSVLFRYYRIQYERDRRKRGVIRMGSSGAAAPSIPNTENGQSEAVCPICYESYNVERFKVMRDMRWLRYHVDDDLKPYVCITGECSADLQFANWRSYRRHMVETHDQFWVVHNEIDEAEPHQIAGNGGESYHGRMERNHKRVRFAHSETDEAEPRRIAGNSGIPRPRTVDKCPFCGFEVGLGREDTGAGLGTELTDRLLRHTGAHLQVLALSFARFLINDDPEFELEYDTTATNQSSMRMNRSYSDSETTSLNFDDQPVQPDASSDIDSIPDIALTEVDHWRLILGQTIRNYAPIHASFDELHIGLD